MDESIDREGACSSPQPTPLSCDGNWISAMSPQDPRGNEKESLQVETTYSSIPITLKREEKKRKKFLQYKIEAQVIK